VHPVLNTIPELKDEVLGHLQEVSEQVQNPRTLSRSVLCHSDLHERQFICANDTLIALIDFGDATILDRHWDLGSVLYFHGERNFAAILEAYSNNIDEGPSCARLAASFSVAIALHHASRSRLPGKEHRLDRAIQWIRQII
jgi:aminoglycoside phosphotransferase (APT) family kinase protein